MKKSGKNKPLKRVNILIPEEIYNEIVINRNLKLSGTVREALEDSLAEHKITLSVSQETKEIYQEIFSQCLCSDSDIEPYLRKCLEEFLDGEIKKKISKLEQIKNKF